MIDYDTIVHAFGPGVTFYEDVYGNRFEFLVVSGPITDKNKVMWAAMRPDGTTQDFLVTKGLEHYGPKLYWESD